MINDKLFFRHVLFHYFDLKKTAAKTHYYLKYIVIKLHRKEQVECERFRNDDFDDKERPGQPKKRPRTKL